MNKKIKIAIILIAIILIATLAISLAYSRYFSKITGTGEATVAKWSFKANGRADNLGTITLGNTASANSKVADGKIAPGTSGKFSVALDATGTEVALDYTIKFENLSDTFPTNLKFYEDQAHTKEIVDITTAGMTGTIGLNDSKTKTVEIYWAWEYQTGADDATKNSNDQIDTTDGETAKNITFDIVVTGAQQV